MIDGMEASQPATPLVWPKPYRAACNDLVYRSCV